MERIQVNNKNKNQKMINQNPKTMKTNKFKINQKPVYLDKLVPHLVILLQQLELTILFVLNEQPDLQNLCLMKILNQPNYQKSSKALSCKTQEPKNQMGASLQEEKEVQPSEELQMTMTNRNLLKFPFLGTIHPIWRKKELSFRELKLLKPKRKILISLYFKNQFGLSRC